MKSIQLIKEKYQKEFALKYCNIEDVFLCKKEVCRCRVMAEIWSYIDAIIPEEFRHLSILDFSGSSKTEKDLLSIEIATRAKDMVCLYCWGMSWTDVKKKHRTEKRIKKFLNKNSIIAQRREQGTNVVIFGESRRPLGRTLIASIIMKEAIKLRMRKGDRGQSYDWIDFACLKNAILKDTYDLTDYRSCDWLVVDNIENNLFSSEKQKLFINDIVTPFFSGRKADNLPTILVFKFDIRSTTFNIGDILGNGIYDIVNNKRTLKIPLCDAIVPEVNNDRR